MRSILTTAVVILAVLYSSAQSPRHQATLPAIEHRVPTFNYEDERMFKEVTANFTEEEGPILFYDDFSSGTSQWLNAAIPGFNDSALWEYRGVSTFPDTGWGSRGAYADSSVTILSATRENGFMIFDSDYLETGGTAGNFGGGPAPAPHGGALTSPAFDCSAEPNVLLSFHSYFRQYDAHGFVLVSTDNFATQDTVYDGDWYHGYNDAGPRDELVKLNISDVAGSNSSVKIRFVFQQKGSWATSGLYFWMIDDVKVVGGSDWDLSIEDVFYHGGGSLTSHYQYSAYYRTIPEKQANAAELTFGAAIRSLSQSTNSNAHLEATVTGGSSFSGTSPNVDYTVFNTADTVDLSTDCTPTGLGMHEVTFEVKGDSADDFPGDNARVESFEVTEQIMGWDDGRVGGAVYWGTGIGYGILKRYDVYAADTLVGVEYGIYSSESFASDDGALVMVGVWKVTGGKIATTGSVDLGQPLASSFVVLTSDQYTGYGDSNKVIRTSFDDPLVLDTGEYLVGWIGQSGNLKTAMSNRYAGVVNSFLTSDGSQVNGWINYNPIIRMVFYDGTICDEVEVVVEGTITCDPAEHTADIEVTASNGDSTATFTYAWNTGGSSDAITVDTEGNYIVTVEDNNQCVGTKQFDVFNGNINCNLGTEEVNATSLNVFPNPSNGDFVVQLGNNAVGTNHLEVTNLQGSKVTDIYLNGSGSHEVGLGEVPAGMYILRIRTQDGSTLIRRLLID